MGFGAESANNSLEEKKGNEQSLIKESPENNNQIDAGKISAEEKDSFSKVTLFQSKSSKPMAFEDFVPKLKLGDGALGKVFLAQKKDSENYYAIKVQRKDVIMEEGMVHAVKMETQVLLEIDHLFMNKMEYLFQDEFRVYIVMPYVRGCSLSDFLKYRGPFSEEIVKFYAAQIILAIGNLHEREIAHRDLTPENIVVGTDGYLKLVDFGLAKKFEDNKPLKDSDSYGIADYYAPELMTYHNMTIDWWQVGILMYELKFGKVPYDTLREANFNNGTLIFPKLQFPKGQTISDQFKDVVRKLLDQEKEERLGAKDDFREVLADPFFSDVDISEALLTKKIKPIFCPEPIEQEGNQADLALTKLTESKRRKVAAAQDLFKFKNQATTRNSGFAINYKKKREEK